MLTISPNKNDDPDFVAVADSILNAVVRQLRPANVFLVRTDHWFDHKWLAFSGKVLGAVGVRKQRLTIPPFVLNRVLTQEAYCYSDEKFEYCPDMRALSLHRLQPSRTNLTRFIDLISKSGVFIWFSGNTSNETAGSIMVYSVIEDSQNAWYASLRRTNNWRLYKILGLSKAEFLSM